MKDSNTASDIDYQSMVKNIMDDFTSPTQIAADDSSGASNETTGTYQIVCFINIILAFCSIDLYIRLYGHNVMLQLFFQQRFLYF